MTVLRDLIHVRRFLVCFNLLPMQRQWTLHRILERADAAGGSDAEAAGIVRQKLVLIRERRANQ